MCVRACVLACVYVRDEETRGSLASVSTFYVVRDSISLLPASVNEILAGLSESGDSPVSLSSHPGVWGIAMYYRAWLYVGSWP